MAWFGQSLSSKVGGSNGREVFSPKRKFRFIVEMGNGGRLVSVKNVKKPVATVETKQYRMINHYYNYPGIVKWEPITITFVDFKNWGSAAEPAPDSVAKDAKGANDFSNPSQRMTSWALWEMLISSGYTPPSYGSGDIISGRNKGISSPEKAATMSIAFGGSLKIHQLHPDGTVKDANGADTGVLRSTETWILHNPIITKISWGELDYGDDGLVEYTLDITYDYAVHYPENQISDKAPASGEASVAGVPVNTQD